ncbi:MAG: YbaK/EbsC family protein [Gammaproteobacteria bacterium]|nr:YbaK/EbsC family protein [Gammaproteobacteria bacterium]MBP9729427.1 YbaK/EbsC family protein [Gammaproteobacteria bacterium]
MHTTLTKSAQKVQDVLLATGLTPKVLELPGSTRTAVDAASTIGCEVAQIVKSLIFKTKQSHKPLLVLTSGPNRVNEALVESQVGEKIVKADADFTREVTGFAIGGIPPVGHTQKIDFIFIDEDLLTFESVWAADGTPNAVFNLGSTDLLAMTGGTVLSIK